MSHNYLRDKVEVLLELCSTDAVASAEAPIRRIIRREIQDLCTQDTSIEVLYDALGSMIVHLPPTDKARAAERVMFCAHIDEVGFLVRAITSHGAVQVITLGGISRDAAALQPVRVTTAQGKVLHGLMSCEGTSPNEAQVEFGFDSDQEAYEAGLEVGDVVCFDASSHQISPTRVMAKALDDRVGVFTLLALAHELANTVRANDIYLAFTSSEEVGTRGGKTATELVCPDLVVAVDVASKQQAGSLPDVTNTRQLGTGCMLVHYDKTLAPNRALIQHLCRALTEHKIPFQRDMFAGGGTDAALASLVGSGRLAVVVGIPLRFCHGPRSLVDLRDCEAARDTLQLISALPAQTLQAFLDFSSD